MQGRCLDVADPAPVGACRVPHRTTTRNRAHRDIDSGDLPALVTRGARVLRPPDDDVQWHVLADPQGNHLCVFATS